MRWRHRGPFICTLLAGALAVVAISAPAAGAAPTCAEGPQVVGDTIVGTPCDDTIRPPRGVTAVFGEGGNDALYGGRGNDSLFGGEGTDRLYGGIGDDRLRGGQDADRLSGGFGADSLDGEGGDDFARGDATIDAIADTGGGIDTLSYATGATPGFFNSSFPSASEYDQFPTDRDGRGAFIGLLAGRGDNGLAPVGGGVDEKVEGTSFETVIGSAFPDVIVGSSDPETIYGGGGGDILIGEGGADTIHGGADGDSCTGATTLECESSDKEVDLRDPKAIEVGSMTPQLGTHPALYLTGSDEDDLVTATYAPGSVTFTLDAGSEGQFDVSSSAAGGCGAPSGGAVVCALTKGGVTEPPDSVLLAGLDGEDTLVASGFPETTSVVLLGGDGDDALGGGATEDALVDGPGDDTAIAGGGDDAVPNNEGADDLDAGPGEDLFVSNAICDGDVLDGGPERDNANWANFNSAVVIDMSVGKAGLVGPGGQPSCTTGSLTTLGAIEDIEGTSLDDRLLGDSGPNQLLGRPGNDSYFAADGNDSILANSGDQDLTIDCGAGFDTAQIDHPQFNDAAPVGCESIYERDKDSFRPPDTPPDPEPETPPDGGNPPPPPPPRPETQDRTPPHTSVLRRPPGRVFASGRFRRVVFAFGSNEAGVSYRCKLDAGPAKPCTSPRAYRLRLGSHALRVFAVDATGNRDSSPLLLRVRIVRR